MKYLSAVFATFLFSFILLVPLEEVSALWISSDAANEYRLENSTFDPELRNETSERWDYGISDTDAYRLEHSTFNPAYQGVDSPTETDPQTMMNRDYNNSLTIIQPDFLGRIRTLRPRLPSIRTDFYYDRYVLYPVRNAYRERIIR